MYENIFQYIAIALFISLIIALANYALWFSKEERVRRRDAKLKFRSVYESDLNIILKSSDDARYILANKETIYQDAMKKFREHLPFWQVAGFDKAWNKFFYHPENMHIPYLEQYMDFGSVTKRKVCHALLRSRIKILLTYADVEP